MDTTTQTDKVTFDKEVERMLAALNHYEPSSEQYKKTAENLEILYRTKHLKTNASSVSMDTIVVAVTNIVGILLILNYEQINVVSSKAISFIIKGRT